MDTSHTFLELISLLLPNSPDLRVDGLEIDAFAPTMTLRVTSTQAGSRCSDCQELSVHRHSRYTRLLADLPWATVTVHLELQVRRFFCRTPSCRRTIFTERLPTVVAPWARRTRRLAERQQGLGLAAGGAAGARIAAQANQPASRDTLLRLVRRIPEQETSTPALLGVDDFALRKGRTYGTILVDLSRGCPIDLLPDRSAETLTKWLAEHPGVEIISRDRAGAYAEGASQGAPDAVQVADRWHILKNLGDALCRVFADLPQACLALTLSPEPTMRAVETAETQTENDTDDLVAEPEEAPHVVPQTRTQQERQQQRERREMRYEQIQALMREGVSLRTIAHHLHLSRETVRKYARASSVPLPQPRAKRSKLLDPYKPYLLERWNAGSHVGTALLREIEAQGYRGGRSIALEFIARIRRQQGIERMKRVGLPIQHASDPTLQPPTPRQLTWLVLQRPERLDEAEQMLLSKVRQATSEAETAVALAQEFARMVRDRQHGALDDWLERAESSGIRALRSFATGIRRDYAAVKAALTLPYSNGVTEGSVNRVKYLKRQMYGRAKFDLLRKRVLYAA